jgi:uncharacterized protein YciW
MELIQKSYDLDYSDERLRQIENLLKSLDKEPSDIDTLNLEPMMETLKSFKNSLILK